MKCIVVALTLFFSLKAFAAPTALLKREIHLRGTIVASSCSVMVESAGSRSGVISFGQYNRRSRLGSLSRLFKVKLYEDGASSPGCSAFKAGSNFVTLHFGDSGQLDQRGVIVHGAGEQVRIEVTAEDQQARSHAPVTLTNDEILYPSVFADGGVFNFKAEVKGLESALPGSYHGSLSLTVSYK